MSRGEQMHQHITTTLQIGRNVVNTSASKKDFSISLAKVTLYSKADVALNFHIDQCQLPIPILVVLT